MNPIEAAVAPLKQDAIEQAERHAKEIIERVTLELTQANNNLDIVAPYPSAMKLSRCAYLAAQARRSMFQNLTIKRLGDYRPHAPWICDMSPNAIARFIEEAKEQAAASYDAFVAKLTAKIGPVTSAALDGNRTWSCSLLIVTLPNGERQTWKTQMILNVSSLGKVFNQFPTRQLKKGVRS